MPKVKLYWIVLILIAGVFIGAWYGAKEEKKTSTANLIAVRDSVKTYEVDINGLKNFVALKNAIIADQKDAIRSGLIEIDRLKALHIKEVVTNAELQGTIKILRDSLKLQPGTVIITVKDTSGVSRDYVRIPFTLLDVTDKYLTLKAGMNENRTAYYDLNTPVSGTMTIGYQKAGFLKTKPVGVFTSQNPNLTIDNMNIVIVQERKKWYQYWYIHTIAGIVVWETGRQLLK